MALLSAWPAIHTMLNDFGCVMQVMVQFSQSCTQSFFDNRMIERHVQHLRNSHARLCRPGQQMRDVLGGGAEHFCTQEHVAAMLGIDFQHSLVARYDPAAALILEGHLSHGEPTLEILV